MTFDAASAKRPTTEQSGASCQAPSSRASRNIFERQWAGPARTYVVRLAEASGGVPWIQPACNDLEYVAKASEMANRRIEFVI